MTQIKDLQEWMARYPDYKEQIRILRQSLGMTQAELAKRVDRTSRSIRTIENGEAYPRVTTLQTLADALKADLIISLVPKPGSEILNECLKPLKDNQIELDEIDRDSTYEKPAQTISGSDIKIGETD